LCPFHCTSEPFITINLIKCGGSGGGDEMHCNGTERMKGRNKKGAVRINRRRLRRWVGQEEIKGSGEKSGESREGEKKTKGKSG
jgi:hypothetical protein